MIPSWTLSLFRSLAVTVFVSMLALASWPALSQSLPVHVDPDARDDLFSAGEIPALRFLTTDDFPPFNYTDAGGRLVGFHVDLANAICVRLSARCTIQAWPWDRVQDALADNQGDALLAGLDINQNSAERFDFSRIYMQLPARFVVRRGDAAGFDASAVAGSIAVAANTPHAELAATAYPSAEIVDFPSEFAALEALSAGEVDLVFADAARASFWLNENPDCCSFAGEAYFRPDIFGDGLAVAVPAGLDNVRVAINWALVRLQREGRLDELYLRWFPVSFY